FRRKSDRSGRPVITVIHPDAPYKVYSNEEWWSDSWEPREYGRNVDFQRPFFAQFDDLMKAVPQPAITNSRNENSDYATYSEQDRNCYLVFASNRNEDCYYSGYIWDSRNCTDCLGVEQGEFLYMCVDCSRCSRMTYCQDCHDSYELQHCLDCRQCHDLFACAGLRNKSFFILNRQYNEAEYRALLGNPDERRAILQKFDALKTATPRLYAHLLHCENVSGDYLESCSRAEECFNAFDLQDAKFTENSPGESRDVYDVSGCTHTELGCEIVSVAYGYKVVSCVLSHNGLKNSLYCVSCPSGQDLFGCVSLRNARHCVLNKQYSEEEYSVLVPKIIDHMRATGEWGEFFPVNISPFAYNETVAQEFFPLSKQEILHRRWPWREEQNEQQRKTKIIPAVSLP
ncbi:MAG: hypothetical protein AAB393_15990, partial [Bacteroidota bacterium]